LIETKEKVKKNTAYRRSVSTLILMIATLLSAMLGLFRNVVFAAQFGTGEEIAAYNAAFRVPDMLFLVFMGGALGSSVIPVFSGFLSKNQPELAWRLANAVINWAMSALFGTAIVAFIFAPQIVQWILVPNFTPAQQELTVNLVRLLLIQPLLIGLGALAQTLLNGMEHFLVPAIAPIIYNVCIIVAAILLGGRMGVSGIVIGVIVGAVLYLAIQIPVLIQSGFRWKPTLDKSAPGLGAVLKAIGPRLIGQAALQINFIIITGLASSNPAYVSTITYAFQVFVLPNQIFAWSVAIVAFPQFSKQWAIGNIEAFKTNLTTSIREILFFIVPSCLGLALLALPIIRSLFELGNFDRQSTELVSYTLALFSIGLVGYAMTEICTRAFFAMQNTRTPVSIALLTIVLNVVLCNLLFNSIGFGGLALSVALTNTLEMLLLIIFLRRRLGVLDPDGKLWLAIFKIMLAADVMATFLVFVTALLREPLNNLNKFALIFLTAIIIGIAALIYGGVAYLLKIEELQKALRRFIKR
jgi:putative peptidoglycan lipid II flippase